MEEKEIIQKDPENCRVCSLSSIDCNCLPFNMIDMYIDHIDGKPGIVISGKLNGMTQRVSLNRQDYFEVCHHFSSKRYVQAMEKINQSLYELVSALRPK